MDNRQNLNFQVTQKLHVAGQPHSFVTIKGLGNMCGRSVDSLKKLEGQGILPKTSFKTARKHRVYPVTLAVKVAEYFIKAKASGLMGRGITTPDVVTTDLKRIFVEEEEKILNNGKKKTT